MTATRKPAAVAAAAAVLFAAGCTPSATGAGPDTGSSGSASAALSKLADLPVKPAGGMDGYARDQFGTAWADVDGNGCDTRNDILARDLTHVRRDTDGCTVLSGTLNDPYTGRVVRFRRGEGTSTAVQIDHLVPLADAWRTGARSWATDKREKLANDPANLLASDGPTNESKGDQDASQWLPPAAAYGCTYVAAQNRVKAAYGLSVTRAEHDAMARVLGDCDGQPSLPANGTPASPTATAGAGADPVHPGSFCSPAGAEGRTEAGTGMVCATAPGQSRPRWRSR